MHPREKIIKNMKHSDDIVNDVIEKFFLNDTLNRKKKKLSGKQHIVYTIGTIGLKII